jgi:hypothetical protein
MVSRSYVVRRVKTQAADNGSLRRKGSFVREPSPPVIGDSVEPRNQKTSFLKSRLSTAESDMFLGPSSNSPRILKTEETSRSVKNERTEQSEVADWEKLKLVREASDLKCALNKVQRQLSIISNHATQIVKEKEALQAQVHNQENMSLQLKQLKNTVRTIQSEKLALLENVESLESERSVLKSWCHDYEVSSRKLKKKEIMNTMAKTHLF